MKNNDILQLASEYYDCCIKFAVIKKLPNGKYQVQSHKGRNLGTYDSKIKAKERLKQVEFFKHDKSNADDEIIDLTNVNDFSLSAIMRELKKNDIQYVHGFLKIYKLQFDNAVEEGLQKPEKVALQNSVIIFNKKHKIKLDKDLVKNAAVTELGDAKSVGKYLSNIVKFTLMRISGDKRPQYTYKLKEKIYRLDENELALKNMPQASAMGQAITFVKHVLLGHDAKYIRDVLNTIVGEL